MALASRALAFASRWFDPATVSSVFEPLIADWQRELARRVGHRALVRFSRAAAGRSQSPLAICLATWRQCDAARARWRK